MATLTIRNLEDDLKERLRVRAAHHRRSMEEEVREILRSSLATHSPGSTHLGRSIHDRFAALGGVKLKLPVRDLIPSPPFDDE